MFKEFIRKRLEEFDFIDFVLCTIILITLVRYTIALFKG